MNLNIDSKEKMSNYSIQWQKSAERVPHSNVPTAQIKLDNFSSGTSYLEKQYRHLQKEEVSKQQRSRDKRQDVDLQQAQPLSQTIYSAQ